MLCLLEVCVSISPLPKPFSPASTWKPCVVPSCACAKCTKVHAIWDRARIGLLLVKTEGLHLQRLAVLQYLSQNWAVWQCVKSALPAAEVSPFSTDSANSLALEGQSWHDKWAEVDFSFKKRSDKSPEASWSQALSQNVIKGCFCDGNRHNSTH